LFSPSNSSFGCTLICCAGIGKSIATRLAQQGLSVVLVALQNEALDATYEELSTEYPKVEFRKVSRLQRAQSSSRCTAAVVFPCTPHHAAAAVTVLCTCGDTYCFVGQSSAQKGRWRKTKAMRLYCCPD
jgi:hypothetical protein